MGVSEHESIHALMHMHGATQLKQACVTSLSPRAGYNHALL